MANEDDVYAYEKNFIAALVSVVSISGAQTVEYGNTAVHKTPRIECGFTYQGADQTDRGLTSDGKQYLRKHNGEINLRVYGTDKAAHLVLVGKVRNLFAWNAPTLINPALAYYQVNSVFEGAGDNNNGEDEEDFELGTSLNFDVVFYIPQDAFDLSNLEFDGDTISFGADALFFGNNNQ